MEAISKTSWLCIILLAASALPARAETIIYLHTDARGSVMAETDSAGNVVKRTAYEPYGGVIGGNLQNGPGFTGHVGDAATGLNYMQQRYYDPQLGMFISADPVTAYGKPVGQFHRYRYANNNPYTNTDPDGRQCNENGCWVTPDERMAALAGDWKGYYQLAGSAGDPYATRAGEVANNNGATPLNAELSRLTNSFLVGSIAKGMGADIGKLTTSQRVAIEFKMEQIRVGLARAHVKALDDARASPDNPVKLERSVIGVFHEKVFINAGADPKVFGGYKVDALENVLNVFGGTSRDVYDYCPTPSCQN